MEQHTEASNAHHGNTSRPISRVRSRFRNGFEPPFLRIGRSPFPDWLQLDPRPWCRSCLIPGGLRHHCRRLQPSPSPSAPTLATPSGVISRSNWAGGNPVPSRMNRNRPITRITLHHDGMQPFTSTSTDAAAARLESIRRSHLQRRPQRFGDIGYHYAIDPAGRVWCCRPLGYQGAHVAGKNPGNLGIVVLGNYDRQSPNRAAEGGDTLVHLQPSQPVFRSGLEDPDASGTGCHGLSGQVHAAIHGEHQKQRIPWMNDVFRGL